MSKDEVRRILGAPNAIYPADSFKSDSVLGTIVANVLFGSTHERWAYGRRRLLAIEPTFPFVGPALDGFLEPKDEDHVIYFSNDGSVLRTKSPAPDRQSDR